MNKISRWRHRIQRYLIIGLVVGFLFAVGEFAVRINTNDPQALFPLLIRGMFTGSLAFGLIALFEVMFKDRFIQKRFIYLVIARSVVYTSIIILCLFLTNIVWFWANGGTPANEEFVNYINEDVFIINIVAAYLIVIFIVGLGHINNLHRKGELFNFIIGRYHLPREVNRIFCFIDLKGSTRIAEKLGNLHYAAFMKDFYSDITDAILVSNAQVYQYVGDEIVLSWSYENGLKENNAVDCFFRMKELIDKRKSYFLEKYGEYPEFRAGLHGGRVVVTWIGEVKKEIVYIGDVLNTTARIQQYCKPWNRDFLVSEDLLKEFPYTEKIPCTFIEEITPRGKSSSVRVFGISSPVI